MIEVLPKTPKETQKIAKILAEEIKRMAISGKGALVIALDGELGAGKTTFAQGFVAGLGIKEKITSPTFLIMKKIELHKHLLKTKNYKLKARYLYHLDCYRLKNEKDLIDLGIKNILAEPENIVLIEWAQKIKKILPKNIIKIEFKYLSDKKRVLKIKMC